MEARGEDERRHIEQLSKAYFGRVILTRSACVDAGLRLAVVGDNGSGKTTLLRIIAGRETPGEGRVQVASGTVLAYLGQQLDPLPAAALTALDNPRWTAAEHELRLAQEALSAATTEAGLAACMTACEEAQNHFIAAGGYDYPLQLEAALTALGLGGEKLRQPLATLSGGERMRVEMAWILLGRPDLLLLDEPTNHLDIAGMEWLEDFLQRFGGTVIYVSHDRHFIDRTATRVAELHGGRLREYRGAYAEYLAQKEIEQDYARQQVQELDRQLACEREVAQTLFSHRKMTSFHAREKKIERLETELESARALVDSGHVRLHFQTEGPRNMGDPDRVILETRGLGHRYGDRELFAGYSTMLTYGEKRVYAGPNGCGKSTLLAILEGRLALRRHEPDPSRHQGRDDGPADSLPRRERRVIDEFLARSPLDEAQARNRLARFGFTDISIYKRLAVLSGGERARLELCLLLERSPDLLLLDEPTNHLDIRSREILERALAEYTGSILAVSHDRYFINALGAAVEGFIEGELRYFVNYERYREAARLYERSEREAATAAATAAAGTAARAAAAREAQIESPADDRRRRARLRGESSRLEREISSLDTEIGRLSEISEPEDPPAHYTRLAELMARHEAAEHRYLEVLLELEAAGGSDS